MYFKVSTTHKVLPTFFIFMMILASMNSNMSKNFVKILKSFPISTTLNELLTSVDSLSSVPRTMSVQSSTHWKSFTSVWLLWCLLSWDLYLKADPHCWHSNDFSPVWMLWCRVRYARTTKAFPHSWHLNGFSSEWIFRWWNRLERWIKAFPHSLQSED